MDREQKLDKVITAYLKAVEAGERIDQAEWRRRYPELADELAEFFAGQQSVERVAVPLRELAQPPSSAEALTLPPSSQFGKLAGPETVAPHTDPLQAAESPIQPGDKVRYFGDYELLSEIARGGMGVVYKARQVSLNRIVALKMILAGHLAGEADVKRFYSEAQTAANLQHPNIVAIHEVGEHNGQHYFSMDFVEGKSLAALIREQPLPPEHAAAIVKIVAEAIHYAHQRGVLHRDLKPANVLIDAAGQPRVTDFGLAKQIEADSKLTATGAVLGTPSYMPPEQASADRGAVGPATDVYSLGAVLYELVTGRPPFQGPTPMDILLQVLSDDPVPPRQLQPKLPANLETICLKCLHKEPQKRYATAANLAEDLRRFLADEPILARPVGNVERVMKWVKRRPMVAGLLASVFLVTVVGMVAFAWAFDQTLDARDGAIQEQKKTAAALADTKIAQEKAEEEKTIAEAATKEMKNQLRRAETLLVQVKFEQAFHHPEEKLALSMLSTAALLRESIVLGNQPLRDSLGLHLGSWITQAHRLKGVLSHNDPVGPVAFSPDGKTVLTGSGHGKLPRGEARLWETAMGKSLGPPLQHQAAVIAVAFSPDGKTVLTGSADKTARLWETATGRNLGAPLQHQDSVLAVSFSPDGKTVLTGSSDKTARLWETATGKPLGPPLQHQDHVDAVAFSPDGKAVLTGSHDMTARLWERATGKPLGPPLKHQHWVRRVAFSPDGKTVLTGSDDNTARLWETATGKPLGPNLKHVGLQQQVHAVAFSPDGKTVLTGGDDNTARLWEAATGKPLGPNLRHQGGVVAVAFSPDGKTVLTGSLDKTARLWETATGKPLGPPLQHQKWVSAVAFSPDGKAVLTGSGDQTARLWEMTTGPPLGPPLKHQEAVVAGAFSPDGKTVLTGSWDKTARLWEAATGKPLGPPLQHQHRVTAVAFSPNSKSVLTGSYDFTAQLWETATGKPLGPPLKHRTWVNAVAFSPDGKTLLTGGGDQTARLWETATGKPLGLPMQHKNVVIAVAFSPDGKIVLTGAGGRTAHLWETATGKPLGPPLKHLGPSQEQVNAVAFSPDGKTVLTGSHDNTARLWETATGKPLGPPLQHQQWVRAVAFSPDGKTVLTGSYDTTARLWETATGKPLGPPLQHLDAVVSVAFSPDGKTVLTGSADKTARLWEPATGRPLGPPLQHLDKVHAVAFSPDGKLVLTGSYDKTARLWRVPRPIQGDPERVLLWTQVITGTELDEHGQIRVLDANTWQQRRQQLEKLGGPPEP